MWLWDLNDVIIKYEVNTYHLWKIADKEREPATGSLYSSNIWIAEYFEFGVASLSDIPLLCF